MQAARVHASWYYYVAHIPYHHPVLYCPKCVLHQTSLNHTPKP